MKPVQFTLIMTLAAYAIVFFIGETYLNEEGYLFYKTDLYYLTGLPLIAMTIATVVVIINTLKKKKPSKPIWSFNSEQ